MGTSKWVQLLGRGKLDPFTRGHTDARKRLAAWERAVAFASWQNLVDLKKTFSSADLVDNKIVFNIGGNRYRLAPMVDFTAQTVLITDVQNAEYSKRR